MRILGRPRGLSYFQQKGDAMFHVEDRVICQTILGYGIGTGTIIEVLSEDEIPLYEVLLDDGERRYFFGWQLDKMDFVVENEHDSPAGAG